MSLEQMIICHCAPVLTGIKAANLVRCSTVTYSNAQHVICNLKTRCAPFGLSYKILRQCPESILVYVYNVFALKKILHNKNNALYLKKNGYISGNHVSMLEQLEKRFELRCGFPHEIGIFLDYPLEDVKGFTKNCGRNCKYCGYWKIYGDVDSAKRLFTAYDESRKKCTELAMRGVPIEKIVRIADKESA